MEINVLRRLLVFLPTNTDDMPILAYDRLGFSAYPDDPVLGSYLGYFLVSRVGKNDRTQLVTWKTRILRHSYLEVPLYLISVQC